MLAMVTPGRRTRAGYVDLMYSTRVSCHVNAPRSAVYQALLDPDAIAKWRVPAGMSSRVHEFDAREGGSFRISLSYDAPDRTGKSASRTDTYHGHFARLVPDQQVVEVLEFEAADPALLLRAEGRIRVAGRACGAHGAYGKAVAATGRGRRHGLGGSAD